MTNKEKEQLKDSVFHAIEYLRDGDMEVLFHLIDRQIELDEETIYDFKEAMDMAKSEIWSHRRSRNNEECGIWIRSYRAMKKVGSILGIKEEK